MQINSSIKNKKCVPCEGGVKPLTPGEYTAFLERELTGWTVRGEKYLEKEFKFQDFNRSLEFINKVGALAEEEGHHPDMLLYSWNHVKITLFTHAIGGLSENDFILASKIDLIHK